MKRLSAIILAIALAVSVMAEPLSAVWMLTGNLRSGIAPIASTDSADTMTVVVTHWHASEESGRPVGESDSSREDAAETLVAQFKNNDGTYTLNGLNDEGEIVPPDSSMIYESGDSFTVSPKAYHADGDETEVYEKFAGFSVTTGNDATSSDGANQLKVTYNDSIRLVKIDVLYEYAEPIVAGTPDSTVFADPNSVGDEANKKDPERDISYVYAYPKGSKAKDKAGLEVDLSGSPILIDGKPLKVDEEGKNTNRQKAIEAANSNKEYTFDHEISEVDTVKVYSVEEGLHTDKTATITENPEFNDGRTFDLQLEAWYSGDNKAKVGLVLDSSGSMAFTSAEPNSAEFNKIKVDEGEIGSLGITKVPAPETKEDAFNGDDWFIKDTDLDKILDTRKTDNSPNGYNGYSYYIYDSRSDTKEFAPIGYWDGEEPKTEDYSSAKPKKILNTKIPQFSNILGYYSFEKNGYNAPATDPAGAPKVRDWAFNQVTGNNAYIVGIKDLSSDFEFTKGDEYRILDNTHNFDDNYGYNASYKDKEDIMQGLLLDVAPSSNSFTLSFKTTKHSISKVEPATSRDNDNSPKANQLIYIGPLSIKGDTPYYNVIRAANADSNIAKMLYQNIDTNCLSSCENIYKDEDTPHFITYVFTDTTVTTYVDGESKGEPIDISDKLLGDGNRNIILNGFVDNYDGMSIFIDDLFVFDCALSTDEVSNLYKNYQRIDKNKIPMSSDSTDEEHYFEVDGNPVGQVPDEIAELSNADDRKGWYYVSSASDYYTNLQTMGTAKDFRGLKVKDSDDNLTKYNYAPDENKFGASSRDVKSQTNYYTYTITSKKESPLKFFVDSKGYLCCFYNTGSTKESEDDRYGWSYVYKKVDTSQTKVEVLQRALGLFATGLQETSPTSSIAATKFSTPNINVSDYNQLVLLNWTNSPDEAAQVLSTSRNKEDNEYSYQMTGGTNTYTGLQSFIDNLAGTGANVNKKYLIIFTDGKDTELGNIVKAWKESNPDAEEKDIPLQSLIMQTRSYRLAEQIRDMGYTIYAIMLSGGSISSELSHDDYRQAVNFLAMLTGEETIDDEKVPITLENEDNKDIKVYDKVYEGSDAGSLITIFSKNIVDIISDDLSEYSVKDYLDPRFDLVDAKNNVWKLNDEGKVSVNGANETLPADITLSKDRESDGQDAVLNYDAGKHLYYLTWEDVTVPGCNSETVSLPVWNATVTVHAKEDFIGGNYVLTNGNMQLENYVLKQGSEEVSSSGTDKAKRNDDELEGEIIKDPSKGFPRTTVNVQIPDITIEGGAQVIYMGEELTPDGVAEKLGETIYDNWEVSKDRSQWYWEYLKRYPKLAETIKNNAGFEDVVYNSFDDIVDEIVGNESTSFNYYYLPPSSEATNVDGETGVKHETDKLGVLKFDWTKVKTGYDSYPVDNITKNTLDKASALTVTYTPSTTIDRQNSNDDGQLQSDKNGSPVYQWDDDFKPAQGSVKESVSAMGSYVTKIVSGQTAFDLKIPADVAEYLSEHYSGYTLTYTATLKREYQARSESDGTYETKTDSVGTYTATYSIPDSVTKSSVDPIVCEGIINYLGEYGVPDYVNNYGLPLGVYSFINPTLTVTKGAQTVENIGVKCGDIEIGEVTDDIKDKFKKYTADEKTAADLLEEAKAGIAKTAATGIEKFAAEIDTTEKKMYIGKNVEPERDYRDNRYGYGYGTLALDTGSLSITKTVVGLATGEANPDTYTIKLSGDPNVLNGEYPLTGINYGKYVTFINGEAEYTLNGGDSITIDELPVGAQIKIEEDVDGKVYTYTKDISPDSVVISTGESTSTVTNTVKTGSLTISKTVEGPVSTGHENDTFKFTVEAKVGETKLSGTYSTNSGTVTTVKFTDGKSDEITLEDGESITIQGLPVGTEFTVVEAKDDNYTTTISDGSGDDNDGKGTIAEENSNVTVTFTNTFITGQLSITKTVENGFSTDEKKEFSFNVGFTNLPSGTEFKYKIGSKETTFMGSPIEIELTPGQTAVFDGLPVGTEFNVEEIDTPACYDVSATVGGKDVEATSGKIIATGTIETTTDNTPIAVAFVNTRKTGSVTIEKKLTAAEGTTLNDNDNKTPFTFTVNLYESDGKTALTGEYSYSGSANGTIKSGGTVELAKDQSITISGLPVDAKVTVSETAKDGFEKDGDQTADVNAEGTAKLTFNNVKKAPEKTEPVTVSAIKNLNGEPSEVQFSFNVAKPDGTTEPVTNDTKGNIEILKDVTFDKVGKYVYTVSENELSGDDAKKYIKDNSVYQITVNVAEEYENGVYTGKLVATTEIKQTVDSEGKPLDTPVTVGESGIIFNNKTKTYSLTVNKEVVLNGRTDIHAETPYGFEVVFEDIDVSKLSLTIDGTLQTPQSGNSITFSLKKDGKAVISNIPYGAHYEISEDKSDDYSMSSEDDLSGNVNGDTTVTVKNTYGLKVAAINATKTLDGGTLTAGQFEFEITDENGAKTTITNKADGSIELIPEKTFAEEESHVYTVREVVDTTDTKIKYDKSVYEITVNVTKNAAGELEATTEIERAVNSEGKMLDEPEVVTEITFNNSVIKPATVTAINATKKLDGEKPEAGLFKFEIADENGAKTTVTNKADGSIELIPEKTYTEEESHVYTVREVVDTTDTKIKYDKSEYEITVNVKKIGDELKATTNIERTVDSEGNKLDEPVDVGKNGIIFNNKAKTYSLTVNKEVVLNGRTDIPAETPYGFEVVFEDIDVSKLEVAVTNGAKLESQNENSVKFSLTNGGKAVISNIPYGTEYEIFESQSDDYSMSSEDDLSGDINSDKEVTVKNTYSLKVAAINATKKLDGGTLAAGQFKFEVTENGVTKTVFNDGDGKIELIPEKTYTEEESHIYAVKEVVDESDPTIKYDKSEYEITVNVKKIGDELKATTNIERTVDSEGNKLDEPEPVDAIVFNNSVVTCSLTVNKEVVLNGRTDIPAETPYGFEVVFEDTDVSKLEVAVTNGTKLESQNENSVKFSLTNGGSAVISKIPYGAHYEISESQSDDYSMSSEDDLSGNVNGDTTVTVKNTYGLKAAAISATKTLDGGTLAAGQFEFEVKENGVTKAVVPNKEDGSIELIPEKTYTEEESHVYTVREVVDESDPTIKYDKSEYEITVNVTKIGDELEATTEIERTMDSEGKTLDEPEVVTEITFNNSVIKPATVTAINAIKTLDGEKPEAGQFKFEITDENGAKTTVTNKADGSIELIPEKTYTEEESHVYTVKEVVDESDTKIKYDKSVYEITVSVTKNGDELKATTDIKRTADSEGNKLDEPVDAIVFNNSIVTCSLTVNKEVVLNGRDVPAETPYGFEVVFEDIDVSKLEVAVTNGTKPESQSGNSVKFSLTNGGSAVISKIPYGTEYEIIEDKSDDYSANSEDDLSGNVNGDTTVTVKNTYGLKVAAINAIKTLDGEKPEAGQFKFEITDENGAKTTVTNKEDGSIELIPEKTYTEEESHVYTVKEVVDENNPKIKYDKSVYEITVSVTKNAAGELVATAEIKRTADSEGKTLDTPVSVTDITFENTSIKEEEQPPEPEIELGSITIRKIVGGSQGDKTLPFEFTLSFENLPIGFDTSTLEISGGRDVKQSGAVITFKLADSEELTVKDIPLGTTYLVVETPVDGYGTTAGGVTGNSSRGPISEQKKNITVEFKNTNPIQEAPLLGGFTVKKTVISDDPDDLETPFEFSIQLDPMPAEPDVSTAYTVSGNVITVHLADGEIAKISSLPYGTSFIVNETQTSGFESRLSETSVASGKISAEQNDFEIEYVNTRTAPPIVEKEEFGNLTIVKFVSGNGFAEGQQFNFTVQLGSDKLYAYTGTGIGPAGGYIKNGDVITLTKNTYIKIHNIPYGTAYSVTEAEADANTVITDGNGIITDGSGIISETNRDAVAQFSNSSFIAPTVPSDPTNPDEPTKLMLTKYVRHTDGTDPDPLAAFTFTVALASPDPLVPFDFSLNCTVEGQLTSWIDANTLSVTLHHGESVMVSGMPVGTTYVITEAPVEGYTSKFITGNETGILGAAGQSVSVVAENTKSTPVFPAPDSSPTGSLTITKEVKSGDKNKPFTFIAEFTPMTPVDLSTVCTLGGNYTSAEWNGNILMVQLTDGQAILIDVIPYGTSYNVYESGSEGYRVTPSEEVGTVSSETPNNVASFSNSRLVGSLSVSKTVSLGSKTKPFTFSIVFTPTEQISLRGICRISGSYTSAVWNENVLTLKLTDGQNAIINGIPSNTAYSIVESDDEGYEVSAVNSEGTIIADTQIKASFTNTLKCGSLTVKKIVGLGNKQQPFTFTVSFTPNSSGIVLSSFTVISGDYTSAVWNGDILTLMLADGQSATISNIPYGTAYSVVEAPVPLYTSTPDEYASGVISAETPEISTVVVNVQNYNPPSGPIPDNPVQPPVVDDGPDTDDIVVIPATESGEGEGDEVAEDNEASEESNPKTGLTLGLGAISAALIALTISKRR